MIYTEITPNPSTIKFVVDNKLFLAKGALDFATAESVGDQSALAKKLFDGGVVVFLLRQHCDEHIGATANIVRAFPIHARVAVDVWSVED